MAISNDLFVMLKRSNAARFEILSNLLFRIGLDCNRPEILPLTPVQLLSIDEVTVFLCVTYAFYVKCLGL